MLSKKHHLKKLGVFAYVILVQCPPDIVIKDIAALVPDEDNEDDEPYTGDDVLEEGDQIFITTMPCEVEFF